MINFSDVEDILKGIFSSIWFKVIGSTLILLYLYQQIDFDLLQAVLKRINYPFLLLLTLITLSFWIVNIISLYCLLIPIGRLHFRTFFKYQLQSIILGSITPMQIGETAILVYLKNQGLPLQKILSAFLLNKVIHFVLMFLTGFIFLYYVNFPYLFEILLGSIICIAGIFLIINSRLRITIRESLIKRYVSKYYDFFEITSDYIRKYVEYFSLNVLGNVLKILIAGFVIWTNFLLFNIETDFLLLLSVYNFSRIASLLPVSIGGLGILEGGVALALSRLGLNYSVVILAMFFLRIWFIVMNVTVLLYYLCQKDSSKRTKSHNTRIYCVTFNTNEASKLYALINNKINARFFSIRKKLGKIILNVLLARLPPDFERVFVDWIKRQRQQKVYISPATFFISRLVETHRMAIIPHYPCQRKFYFGLTFDIDYKQDYDLLPYFIDDLTKYRFPATINLVTHADYTISSSFISDLQKNGFEIGLHGDTHNTALAFLPKTIIRRKLLRAIDKLGFLPFGYRSPGLSYSRNLIKVLDELGFVYDSSLTTGISMYRSLEFPYIFQHAGFRIVEVPLFMQDYNFFVNGLYSEQEVIRIFETQVTEIAKIGGVALINLHPIISSDKKVFWRALLECMEHYKETAYISTIYRLLKH